MTIHLSTLTAALAALNVSGMTIKDTTNIPDAVGRDCPVLIPEVRGFVTNLSMARDSLGSGTGGYQTVEYDLNYTYLHAPAGEGRGIRDLLPANISALALLVETINTTEFSPFAEVRARLSDTAPALDPVGATFHGGHLVIHVSEFLEV
jgi:hypothetical protein